MLLLLLLDGGIWISNTVIYTGVVWITFPNKFLKEQTGLA